MSVFKVMNAIGYSPVRYHRLRLRSSSNILVSDYMHNNQINHAIFLQKINALQNQFSPSPYCIESDQVSVKDALDYFFNTIYMFQKKHQNDHQLLSDDQLLAVQELYDILKTLRQFKANCYDVFGGWSRTTRYSYRQDQDGQSLIAGYRYVSDDDNCTALTSYLKDVLAYERCKMKQRISLCDDIDRSDFVHRSDKPLSTINGLIGSIKKTHPSFEIQDSFKCIERRDKTIPISFFIRRIKNDPSSFLETMIYNTYRGDQLPEIRPATAVGVLKDDSGCVITGEGGGSVSVGLLGDSFPFKKKGSLCEWSEQGEFIFDNTADMVTAQKCDIWSGSIPLSVHNGCIDITQFQFDMQKRADETGLTHIEGKWLDKELLYKKMVNQAKKALGLKRLGSSKKVGYGRRLGVPKNKYSDYVKLFRQFGVIPHNEAFMIHDLHMPFRIGINTHSKKAIENSLKLYVNTVDFLKRHHYGDFAKKIILVIYNNRTGEVKRVHPDQLYQMYLFAPDEYTFDHCAIHPDEVLC